MGYNTDFTGEMYFNQELTGKQIAALNEMLGEDCREHPEWLPVAKDLTWIDLEFNDDYSGIQWNGSEKSYDMAAKLNLIVAVMRRTCCPDFGFNGKIEARDEENDYLIKSKEDGFVEEVALELVESEIECPKCGHCFSVSEVQ